MKQQQQTLDGELITLEEAAEARKDSSNFVDELLSGPSTEGNGKTYKQLRIGDMNKSK